MQGQDSKCYRERPCWQRTRRKTRRPASCCRNLSTGSSKIREQGRHGTNVTRNAGSLPRFWLGQPCAAGQTRYKQQASGSGNAEHTTHTREHLSRGGQSTFLERRTSTGAGPAQPSQCLRDKWCESNGREVGFTCCALHACRRVDVRVGTRRTQRAAAETVQPKCSGEGTLTNATCPWCWQRCLGRRGHTWSVHGLRSGNQPDARSQTVKTKGESSPGTSLPGSPCTCWLIGQAGTGPARIACTGPCSGRRYTGPRNMRCTAALRDR